MWRRRLPEFGRAALEKLDRENPPGSITQTITERSKFGFHSKSYSPGRMDSSTSPFQVVLVEFQIAIRRSQKTAANVNVIEWPVQQQTIEEYFAEAEVEVEELPLDFSTGAPADDEIFSPTNRKKTLYQLMQERNK